MALIEMAVNIVYKAKVLYLIYYKLKKIINVININKNLKANNLRKVGKQSLLPPARMTLILN